MKTVDIQNAVKDLAEREFISGGPPEEENEQSSEEEESEFQHTNLGRIMSENFISYKTVSLSQKFKSSANVCRCATSLRCRAMLICAACWRFWLVLQSRRLSGLADEQVLQPPTASRRSRCTLLCLLSCAEPRLSTS